MSRAQPIAVTVSRVIPASPDEAYDVVSDVTTMGDRSPETVSASWLDEPGARVGARFVGTNRLRFLRWSTTSTVTIADPGRTFAFVVPAPSHSTWSYAFEAIEGGTLVTESIRQSVPQHWAIRMMQRCAGVGDRAGHLRLAMETTLDRLAESLATTSPTNV